MKMKGLRVGLTYDLAKDYELGSNDPKDKYLEFDNRRIIGGVAGAIKNMGHAVVDIGNFGQLLEKQKTVKNSVDIVFNLAEGLEGRNRESQVPIMLEYLGVPYVGSDALTMGLTLDKVVAKKMFTVAGVPTPRYITTLQSLGEEDCAALGGWPLIVKTRWEGSSKGITAKSKVKNLAQLNDQIKHIVTTYRQPALVEEFVSGREFTVGIIGSGDQAYALPAVEIRIRGEDVGDRIYVGRYVYTNDAEYICPVPEEDLGKEIEDLAMTAYRAVDCQDFGRVDVRMDAAGHRYVLEVNPLPALSRQDVFGVIAETLGLSYQQMVQKVLAAGIERLRL